MAYRNEWNSPDQIPQRAVDQGLISEFGSIDTDVGGEIFALQPLRRLAGAALGGDLDVTAYAIDSSLQAVLRLHLFPRRPGQWRRVRAGR